MGSFCYIGILNREKVRAFPSPPSPHYQLSLHGHISQVYFSWKSRGRQQWHLTVDSQQWDIFHCKAIVASQSSNGFLSLKLGIKCKSFNRHNTGEIMTSKIQAVMHSEMIPHLPVVFVLVCNTVQKTQVFNNTGICTKPIYNDHLVLPWMSEPQVHHFEFQMHSFPQWTK